MSNLVPTVRRSPLLLSFGVTLSILVLGGILGFTANAANYNGTVTGTLPPVNWTAMSWGCATIGPTDVCGPYPGSTTSPFPNSASIGGTGTAFVNSPLANPFTLNTQNGLGLNLFVSPGGVMTLTGNSTVTGTSGATALIINGGTLTNNGNLTVQSIGPAVNVTFDGGTFDGTGTTTIGTNGTFNISGTQGPMTLNTQNISNQATANFNNPSFPLTMGGGATFTNAGTGTFSASGSATINLGAGGATFNNAGNWQQATGGSVTVNIPFNNTNQVNLTSTVGPPTLSLLGGVTTGHSGATWNTGVAGNFNFGGNHTFNNAHTFTGPGNVNIAGGGSWIINTTPATLSLPASLSNSGGINFGTTFHSLSVGGTYSQAPTGALQMKIGPPNLVSDTLTVTGAVSLSGTYTAALGTGYTPTNGDTFNVLSAGSRFGDFTTKNLPGYAGGVFQAQYLGAGPTVLQLIAAPTVDVSLVKTGPSSVLHNQNATYSIKVENLSSPNPATSVVITDTFSSGTFVSASVPGGTCSLTGPGVITCNMPSLPPTPPPAAVFITVVLNASALGSITNTATLTSLAETDSNGANDFSTIVTTVTPASDLSIAKTGAPDPVPAGGTQTYTLTVSNAGPDTAGTVSAADLLPAGFTLVSASGIGWSCSGTAPIICTMINLAPASSAPPIIIVVTAPAAGGSYTNQAQVGPTIPDPVPANNNTSVTVTVTPSTDISISKVLSSSLTAGSNATYSITVTNGGPSDATGVVVSDSTPAGMTFVSNSGACTTAFPCTIGNLTAGSSATINTTFLVSPAATGSISNTATVTSSTSDPNSANNSSTATGVVSSAASADLLIIKRGPGTVAVGTVDFTIAVRNLGPGPALNVVVNDPTPAGATFVSNSGACTTPFPCNLLSIPAGLTRTIISTFAFSTTAIRNTATVTSSTPDPTSTNNSSSATVTNLCPTDAPVQTNPPEGAAGISLNGTLNWTDVGGTYEVYLGPAGGGCNTLFATTSSTFASYSNLIAGQEYESRIVATGPGCPSFSSRCIKWRAAGGGCALQAPTLTEPLGGATGRPSPVRLGWTRVDGADLYTIFVGVNGATPTEIGSTAETFFIADIPTGTVVWYVVASQRGCANTARSVNGTFDSCNPPAAPVAGVEGAPISGVTYSVVWDAVAGAVRYEVDEADNVDFVGATTQSTTSTSVPFTHPTVGAPRAFFYRVRAFGTCTNVPSANSRTVRGVTLPATPTASVNVPKGTDRIKHTTFIPGEPDGAYDFIATTDNPRAIVTPPAGVLLQHPGGVNLDVEFDLLDLGDGTFTITVILNLIPRATASIGTHAVTSKSQPVSVNLVTPVKPGDVSAPTAETLIIPSVGHLAGINSLWRSDIRVLNTASQKARYQLDFITSGAADVKQTIIEVDTNSTVALDDIVHNWFGFGEVGDSANGILEIRPLNTSGNTAPSPGPSPTAVTSKLTTAASSRTFSTSANGTLGQFIPAMPFAGFIGKAAPGATASVLSLQQIAQSASYRTNVGVVEAAGKPVSVVLSIFTSGGSNLADVPLDLKAGEQKQLNGFLATQGLTLDDGRIEVRVTDGDGKVTAYASVIDNKSIDPLLVPAVQVGATTAQRYVLPGVADLNTGSASWRTDMRIFNGGSTVQSATLTFHPQNNASAPLSTSVTVNPGEVLVLNSVLESLFSARDVGGAIHVLTANNSQLTVTGRTYNQTSSGTFGQFIPAVTLADAADRTSRALHILQVEDSVRFRTNIGIAEVTGNAAVVEVTVNLPESKVTPKVEIPLAANEFRQFAIIKDLGLQNVYNARVTVKVISGNGAVTAYGSVVDMLTTDPMYVRAQ